MKRIGFVTSSEHAQLTPDDRLVLEHLPSDRVQIVPAVWDSPEVSWEDLDACVIRSPWDYTLKYPAFLSWLSRVDDMGIKIWNPPDILRWNSKKEYLADLEDRGFKVPPTAFIKQWERRYLDELELDLDGPLVVKPTVSASARRTYRIGADQDGQNTLDNLLLQTDVMVQPYLPEIETKGEYSFVFFWGELSHVVVKKPKPGDFRVQTYYGGSMKSVQAPPGLVEQAKAVVDAVDQPLLYARVDGIDRQGEFILMELELFEPSLYLGTHPDAPAHWAQALNRVWE